jgi:hypothetical protein
MRGGYILDFLDLINGLLFLFFFISVPLFLLPFILAMIGFYKKNELKATIIIIGYLVAIVFGVIVGFDESFILLIIVYTFFFLARYIEKNDDNTYKMIISILLAIFCLIGVGVSLNAPFGKISPQETEITEQKLVKDIKLIASKNIRILSVEVWGNGQHPNVKVTSDNPNTKIIKVGASTKHIRDNFTEPFEVQEAMKIFLYVQKRKLPYEVAGVHVSVSHKWVMAQLPQVLISTNEFEEIYQSINVEGPIQ